MASDMISNLAGLFTKERFEALNDIHLYASDIQSEQLFNLLREAETTSLAKEYDFKTIISYQDFRERLPLTGPKALEPYIRRIENGETNLLWTGIPKQILSSFGGTSVPVSEQALAETFTQGFYDSYIIHLHRNPYSRLFGGYFVTVGNESELPLMDELEDFLRRHEPFVISLLNRPKYTGMVHLSDNLIKQLIKEIKVEKVSCYKGSPKSLQRLVDLAKKEDGTLPAFLTEAEILFHKTTATSEELRLMKRDLQLPFPIQSMYCSPEGFFGIQDYPENETFLLMLDLSQFYEFIPQDSADNQPIPLEDTVPNVDYQLVLTNCSGLWRYLSGGPKLRFVSTEPYRFLLV